MIELIVALSAGLMIALAAFTLMRTSNATFREEDRVATAEVEARNGLSRLRSDISRAGLMSTGNIKAEPSVNVGGGGPWPVGLNGLAAFRLIPGGSVANTVAGGDNPSTLNGLTPDALEVAGNFSRSEPLVVTSLEPAGGQNGCARLWLDAQFPSVARLTSADGGSASLARELRQAFQPTPAGETRQFMARVYDVNRRCTRYLTTCPVAAAAGVVGGKAYVDLSGDPNANGPAPCSITDNCAGASCLVNPVQWVRWEIGRLDLLAAQSGHSLAPYAVLNESTNGDAGVDGAKFSLVRRYLDAARAPATIPEVVAEYAVDVRFAFTVNDDPNALGLQPRLTILPIEGPGASSANWAADQASMPFATYAVGPHRIRSVQVRLVTRAALGDRDATLPSPGGSLIYRYCIQPGVTVAQCRRFARTRTITGEIGVLALDEANY